MSTCGKYMSFWHLIKFYIWHVNMWQVSDFLRKKIQYAGHRSCTQKFSAVPTKIVQDRNLQNSKNLNGIGDGNNKNPTRHVFKYKHMKWSRWCITASLNYKNTTVFTLNFLPYNLQAHWACKFKYLQAHHQFYRPEFKNYINDH